MPRQFAPANERWATDTLPLLERESTAGAVQHWQKRTKGWLGSFPWAAAMAGLVAFLFLFWLQIQSGSRQAGLGQYPDEAGHYVTGQMVREYLTGGWREASPMGFAERYYIHYPKVAFGHWPPMYYVAQAAWSLVAGHSVQAWLLLQPLFLALTSVLLFARLARQIHPGAAALLSLTFCVFPVSIQLNGQMMAEPLLCALTLASVCFAAAYFENGKVGSMVGFGVMACLAAYTKGSGLALFALPFLLAVSLGRWEVLGRRGFWLPQAAAWAGHLPWLILTLPMARNGMEGEVTPGLMAAQALGFLALLPREVGWPLLVGFAVSLAWVFRRGTGALGQAAALAAVLVLVFHSISPNGVESRRLMMGFPLLVLVVGLGARNWPAAWQVMAGFCALGSVAWLYSPQERAATGYREVGTSLREFVKGQPEGILIASQADGEGMLIADMAEAQPSPSAFLIRSSKLLADSDWNGADYKLRADTVEGVQHLLDAIPVRFVVVDNLNATQTFQHVALVQKTIEQHPARWRLRRTVAGRHPINGRPGRIEIYERFGEESQAVRHLEVDLSRMLGRKVSRAALEENRAVLLAPATRGGGMTTPSRVY